MTLADVTTRVNFLTGTTVNEYSAPARLVSLNKWYYQAHNWIMQSMDGWHYDDSNATDFPFISANLVAGQQDYGGLLTERVLRMKRAEITYDGTNWVKLTPFDLNEDMNATDSTSVSGDFSQANPRYRMVQNSILVYPVPDTSITDGLKLFVDRSIIPVTASDVTTGTLVLGFDINFHDIVPMGMAYDYNSVKKGDKSLMEDILALKFELMKHYSSKTADKKLALSPYLESYD